MKKIKILLVCMMCLLFCGCKDEKADFVKAYMPETYPDISYGEVFENFFVNTKWKSKGDNEVLFTGTCLYQEKEVHAEILFKVNMNKKTVDVSELSYNKDSQNQEALWSLLEIAFNDEDISSEYQHTTRTELKDYISYACSGDSIAEAMCDDGIKDVKFISEEECWYEFADGSCQFSSGGYTLGGGFEMTYEDEYSLCNNYSIYGLACGMYYPQALEIIEKNITANFDKTESIRENEERYIINDDYEIGLIVEDNMIKNISFWSALSNGRDYIDNCRILLETSAYLNSGDTVFCFLDMDGDGNEELLIGNSEYYFFRVYTRGKNDEASHVAYVGSSSDLDFSYMPKIICGNNGDGIYVLDALTDGSDWNCHITLENEQLLGRMVLPGEDSGMLSGTELKWEKLTFDMVTSGELKQLLYGDYED